MNSEFTITTPSRTIRPRTGWIGGWLRAALGGLAASLILLGVYYGYRYYGPTPWRTLRLYVQAVNANDFDAQYNLFAPAELKNPRATPLPLLPKEQLRRLLAGAAPPSPNGLRLSIQALEVNGFDDDSVIGGAVVPVLDAGKPRVPRGPRTDSYCVALQHTPQGWKVRAFMTYWVNYGRFYGPQAADRLKGAYLWQVQRLAMTTAPRSIADER